MHKSNYHSHSHFCDGKSAPETHLLMAIEKGFDSFGFSSHAPLPFNNLWSMKLERLEEYKQEISMLKEKYRSEIDVYCGLEADFIPKIIGPNQVAFAAPQFDYIIGSIHFVDQDSEGIHWEIDGSHDKFKEGLKKIFYGNIRKALFRYFELTRQMVRDDAPDIVGHLDKIKIQNQNFTYFSEEADWYKKEVMKTLEEIAGSRCIIEVNTRGLYKKKSIEVYPGHWILKKINEMKIPITLNSDSHHPEEIDMGFEETLSILKAIGLKNKRILQKGEWIEVPL